jgi:hypothetical protein
MAEYSHGAGYTSRCACQHVASSPRPGCSAPGPRAPCGRRQPTRTRRPGLSARAPLFGGSGGGAQQHSDDHVQINLEAGTLDLDDEIEQLRGSVGRLKQASAVGTHGAPPRARTAPLTRLAGQRRAGARPARRPARPGPRRCLLPSTRRRGSPSKSWMAW